ncbi:MAG: low specificity L-threonine aldolase, partial [Clostridia bacterium]|nr:low specificity L-threonine aldolase [Clostridia bacterium]
IREGMERAGIAQFIKTTTNQVFPVITREQEKALAEKVEFEHWGDVDDTHVAIRFVTSWATKEEDVRVLCAELEAL